MFWESAAAYSQINDILSRPNLTIKEVLDDDDVLQKCREKDPRLINFLSRSDNLDYLIDLVSRTPKCSNFNRDLYRYSSLACEILTNDINEILDGIIELTESTTDQHTPNESHNNGSNNSNNHNNHMLESNQIKSIPIPSSFSSPLPSSSMIINDHSLTEINNNNNDQSCYDMFIVGNNSSELHQIDHYSNVHDDDGTNHLSSSMSIINESSSIINGHNSSQLFDNNNHNNSVNDLNEILSSSLKLSPPMSLSTPHSSTITKITKSNEAIQVDSSMTTCRRRLDLLLNFFHYSNQPVNPLSASFVSRLLIHLTLHRGNIIIPYLRSSNEFLDQLFLSLDSSSVADLIIQLSQQETKQQHIIFEWFKTDRLVERLIEKFDPIYSSDAHESAAHCLIELITVLRNYLVNNPPNSDNSDMIVNSMTTATTTTNNVGGSSIFGSPLNSTYSSLFDKDEETYKAAENLLNVLESEETMSMLLNRITANEYVVPSILVSCVNVCIALIGKRKPESSFPVGEDGHGLDFDALIKCSGDISSNLKCILRNNTNLGNNLSSTVDNDISDLVEKSNQFITSSKDDNTTTTNNNNNNNNNNTVIDKLHIMKASENLIKTSLPRLNELHDLLKRFHPQFYNCMPTTHCTLNPPLGRCRLAILQLIASLISLPISTNLSKAIVDIGFVKTSMELFALYPYNTFLHHYVTDIIKSVFKHSGLVNNMNGNNNSTNISDDNKTNHFINTTPSTITVELSSNHDNNQITESLSPSISSSSSADSSTNTATTDSDNVVNSTNSSNTNQLNPYDNGSDINLIHQNENEYSRNILISLIKDHQLIDWCLTLSPLPSLNERPNDEDSPNCLVRLSKHPVKSGYSGHIWQIGNLIVAAMNGPYGKFLKSLIQDLHPNTQKLWSDFVKDLDGINSVEVAETSQSAIENLNHSDVPFVLAPVTSSNLMQNKLLDLNGKSSSYFLDDIDNDKHDEYGKNNHEYLAYHPVIPASTIVNLHRQTILQNFMDSWLDPDEESEHNDNSNSIYDHNNNNQSEEKDQVKTPDIHIGVPGPLGEMYFHNNIDSDDDFFNGRDNEDDEKDENDELEEGKDNIHSRGYFNIEEDDDDDDDEEDLKSPIQIKQQHSSKQSIINTSSSTPLLHNDSNKLTGVYYVTTHNNESSISINSNGKLSTTIPPTTTTTHTTTTTTTTTINSSISEDIEIKLLNNDEETDQTKHNTSSESIVTLLNANFFKK